MYFFQFSVVVQKMPSSRSSCPTFVKKVLCEIFQNSKGSICAGVSFLIKVRAWYAPLLKKGLLHRYFLLNFEKCHKIPFQQNKAIQLLLIFPSVLKVTYLTHLLPMHPKLLSTYQYPSRKYLKDVYVLANICFF